MRLNNFSATVFSSVIWTIPLSPDRGEVGYRNVQIFISREFSAYNLYKRINLEGVFEMVETLERRYDIFTKKLYIQMTKWDRQTDF